MQHRWLAIVGLTTAAFAVGIGGPQLTVAGAATRSVETSGADAGDCTGAPCATPAYAVGQAATGDTVAIGPGTFAVPTSIVVGAKSLTIQGAGASATTLDGGDAVTYATDGMLRFASTSNGTTQVVQDLGFTRAGRRAPTSAARVAVHVAAGNQTVNLTLRRSRYTGGSAAETPFLFETNQGAIEVAEVQTTGVTGNSVQVGRQAGPFTLRDSTLETAAGSASAAFYGYTWNASSEVTGAYQITGNTLRARSGAVLAGGFAGLVPNRFTGGVTITDNRVETAVEAPGIADGAAIGISNISATAGGADGTVEDVLISGNTLVGSGTGSGVRIAGNVPAPLIAGNNIRGYGADPARFQGGVSLRPAAAGHAPSDVSVERNQLVDNGASNRTGLYVREQVTGTIERGNWWGCNAGPGDLDCDQIVAEGGTTVTRGPWVQLGLSASPSAALGGDASAAVTATLGAASDGSSVNGVFAPATPLTLTAAGGTLSDPAPPLDAAATATSIFTSGGLSGRAVSATKDHQTVSVGWPDVVAPPDPPDPPGPEPEPTPPVTPDPGPAPSPGPVPLPDGVPLAEDLPTCAKQVAITNLRIFGRSSQIRGIARLQWVGQRVPIFYGPSGDRPVAQALVGPDGRFSAMVRRPRNPSGHSNAARYRARLGNTGTPFLKLTRRLTANDITYSGGKLRISGVLSAPRLAGKRITVWRADRCTDYREVGTLRARANGRFSGAIDAQPSSAAYTFVRLTARVRRDPPARRHFTTYSIPQPVLLQNG